MSEEQEDVIDDRETESPSSSDNRVPCVIMSSHYPSLFVSLLPPFFLLLLSSHPPSCIQHTYNNNNNKSYLSERRSSARDPSTGEGGWSREEREGLCLLTHVRLAGKPAFKERKGGLSLSLSHSKLVCCLRVCVYCKKGCLRRRERKREKGSHAGEAEQRQVISVETTLVPGSWFRLC